MKGQNASILEKSLIASIEVRTGLGNEHLTSNDVLTKNGLSHDMEKQENELFMSNKESMVRNQCFMTTGRLNEHVEECASH